MSAQPDPRRARGVLAATAIVGGALLNRSLRVEPDSRRFYLLTGAVAVTSAAGAVATMPRRRGCWRRLTRDVRSAADPVAIGVGAFTAFYGAARVARRVPVLDRALRSVLAYSHEGSDARVLATALTNGIAEEMFFRGAVYDAATTHPAVASTATYLVVTAATGNPALVLAAAVMGSVFVAQRRRTGGIAAPIITHVTWSTLMLRFVPPLFDRRARQDALKKS